MPIPIIDKLMHRPYDAAVRRASSFVSTHLGYTGADLNERGELIGTPLHNGGKLVPSTCDAITTLRDEHARTQEIYAELERKLKGNERRLALSPENAVFVERKNTIETLMRVIRDHSFYDTRTIKRAVENTPNYSFDRKILDDFRTSNRKFGLFLREHRATGALLGATALAAKIAVVYEVVTRMLHSSAPVHGSQVDSLNIPAEMTTPP